MVTSSDRGHEIYYDSENYVWRYKDNNKKADHTRTCERCKCNPTKEGHDARLGTIKGATSACCGHGIEKGWAMMENGA